MAGDDRTRVRAGLPTAEWMASVTVPGREVVVFLRQLSVLFRSGIPLNVSLQILYEQTVNPKFSEVVYSLYHFIDEGRYFSAALAKFPRVFGPIFIGLIRVGERTGSLLTSMDMLATWLERDQEVREKVRSAMVYPLIVLFVSTLCAAVLMTTLAPAFIGMFSDRGMELPLPTRVVKALVEWQKKPLFWVLLLVLAVAMERSMRQLVSTPQRRARLYWIVSYIPVARLVLEGSTWSRYCGAMGIMLSCGVAPQVLYRLAADASGDPRLILGVDALLSDLHEGVMPSEHMRRRPELYPKMVSYGIAVGEDSGRSPQITEFLARSYRMELDYRISQLTSLLEPVLLGGTSMVLLFIILALLLPIYGQLNSLGG